MILLSTSIQEVFGLNGVESFYLLKISDVSEDPPVIIKAITTNPFDVTYDGQLYLSTNELLAIAPLNITTVVNREEFSFTMSDTAFNNANTFESSIVGKKVEVFEGFYHPTTNLILEDYLLIYAGYGDGAEYNIKTSELGEVAVKVTCTSPMADLSHKKGLYLSKEAARNRNPRDTSCDYIYNSSGNIQLKWGKR